MLTTFFYTHSVFLKYLKIDNCHYKNYLPTLGFLINVPGTFINFDKFFQGGTYLDEIRLVHFKNISHFSFNKRKFFVGIDELKYIYRFCSRGYVYWFLSTPLGECLFGRLRLFGNAILSSHTIYSGMLFWGQTLSFVNKY